MGWVSRTCESGGGDMAFLRATVACVKYHSYENAHCIGAMLVKFEMVAKQSLGRETVRKKV